MHKKQTHVIAALSLATMLTGCATNEQRLLAPVQKGTILGISEWDACQQAPGSITRAQRAAREKTTATDSFGDAPVAQGTPEQDASALGGAIKGAEIGLLAGSGPSDILVGAAAVAAGGILLATQDVEECYQRNEIRLKIDGTGEVLNTYATKKRSPRLAQGKSTPKYAFPAGEYGSEHLKIGDSVHVVRVAFPSRPESPSIMALSESDCDLYHLCN